MKKAVFFDLDGTLLNTLPTIAHYVNRALRQYTDRVIDVSCFRRYLGNGARVLIERAVQHHGLSLTADQFEALLYTYNSTYDKAPYYLTKPYDGITEMLASLSSQGIACAVISNKPDPTAKQVVNHFFGDSFNMVCGAVPNIPLKPEPDAVISMMSKMEVSAEQALFVGDTSVDMTTARCSSVESIGVLWGFRDRAELEEAGADHIVSHPKEISELIHRANTVL